MENHDLSAQKSDGEQMDHYNIDNATTQIVINAVTNILNSLKDGETITINAEDLQKLLKKP